MTKRRSRFEPRLNTAGDVVSIVLPHLTAEVVSVVEKLQVTRAGAVSPPYSIRFANSVEKGGLAPSPPKLKKIGWIRVRAHRNVSE